MRLNCAEEGKPFSIDNVPFHEGKPAEGAWSSDEVIEFMMNQISKDTNSFYILCPDNETSLEVDYCRIRWAMEDITKNRVPLSRWHAEYKPKFNEFLNSELGKDKE